jgi:signal peptidase II
MNSFQSDMIYTLLTACLAAADLVTKALARRDRHIRKIYNPGFSFGHLKEHPFIVKGIPTAVGILSAVKWARAASPMKKTAYSMILAGAIGNTCERVKQGYVTDFINIPKGRIRTWFFNIADLCVAAGAVLMILGELTESKDV